MRLPNKTPLSPTTNYSIAFQQGRLLFLKDGQFISLTSPIVLENGVIISTDGTIQLLDGSKKKLLEGDTFHNFWQSVSE